MEMETVYVGIPGLTAQGTPMESDISDAVVEQFEVDPQDVTTVEKDGKFYVFINSLPVTFASANQTVAHAAELSQTYDHQVARLTKLVRRSDKYQNDGENLRKELQELKAERDELAAQLQEAENIRQERVDAVKNVERDLQQVIECLGKK